jgi:hypothetical protein
MLLKQKADVVFRVWFFTFFKYFHVEKILVLKPNQTDCILDEQCSRACITSYCNRKLNPSRCLCNAGYHYLFGKCCEFLQSLYKSTVELLGDECPTFATKLAPLLDDQITATQCLLNKDYLTVNELEAMSRQKRDFSATYC